MKYKEWLDNEYRLWVEALQSSTVYNFKDNLQVKRMLSTELVWTDTVPRVDMNLMRKIDQIGYSNPVGISGACLRMIYYADQILRSYPPSIVEIGGGAGQFYAVLRAMGYSGEYSIIDLPEVERFQTDYLHEVHLRTGLSFPMYINFDFCISLYALGEFDDKAKAHYIEHVVSKCPQGFIVWNPHSGATEEIPFQFEYNAILQKDGSKLLIW